MLIPNSAELGAILTTLPICPPYNLRTHHNIIISTKKPALLLINMHLHYSKIFMLTPTTNSSRMELGESVIFQPVLQAYPTWLSWIITALVSLGNRECHWKTFNRQLDRTQQLLHSLDQQPSTPTQLLSTLQVALSNIKDIYNSVETTIISAIKLLQSNQPQTHIHSKRSLLPFLGDALSWLTGTATTKDIHGIKTRINQLIATQASQQETLENIVSILNVTRYATQVNRCGINALMDAVRATSYDINNLYNLITSLATSIHFHQLILHISQCLLTL